MLTAPSSFEYEEPWGADDLGLDDADAFGLLSSPQVAPVASDWRPVFSVIGVHPDVTRRQVRC